MIFEVLYEKTGVSCKNEKKSCKMWDFVLQRIF